MHDRKIISKRQGSFSDRSEAANLLARELKTYAGSSPVVLGIPRGGVLMAAEIARQLSGELDVVLSHKLSYPGRPDAACGSITESGKVFLESYKPQTLLDEDYLASEKEEQLELLSERAVAYRKILPKVPLNDRIAIVTDDGVATGLTMRAALWSARQEKPKKLIAAIPVAPEETVEMLAPYADQTICLLVPDYFFSVSQFYARFEELKDAEVLELLKQKSKK